MTRKIKRGVWDCPFCIQKRLDPRQMTCPNCNGTRPTDITFYLPDDAQVVTSTEELEFATAGPNWICEHCKVDNANTRDICSNCGAHRGTSPSRPVIHYDKGETPNSAADLARPQQAVSSGGTYGSVRPSVNPEKEYPALSQYPAWDNRSNKGFKIPSWLVGVLVIAGIIGLVWFLNQTRDSAAKIIGFEWSRTIHVQTYMTVREEGWQVPSGGRQVSVRSAVHHYEKVYDHTETKTEYKSVLVGYDDVECGSHDVDMGNGYFEEVTDYCKEPVYKQEPYTVEVEVYRDEPVYADWYTYDIEKWVNSRQVKSGGTNRNDPPPYFSDPNLNLEGQLVVGAERKSGQEEHYVVIFSYGEGQTYRREVSLQDWNQYDPSREYILQINRLGTITNNPLRPEK